MRQTVRMGLCVLVGVAITSVRAPAQQWTRFRGPGGRGVGAGGDSIPVKWTAKNYLWKVRLPGGGHGSPVLWGQKLFVLSGEERTGKRVLLCLGAADGKEIWRRELAAGPFEKNRLNAVGASTPTVDAKGVYVCLSTPRSVALAAFGHEGAELWRRDFGTFESMHGPCQSPVAYEGLVILPNDQQGPSSLLAVDAATGKTRWKTPRKAGRAAYGTPCVFRPRTGPAELIFTSTAEGITSVDPTTGRVNWRRADAFPQRCVGSPAVAGGLVLASCGQGSRGVRMVAVRPDETDKPPVAWDMKRDVPYVPTPIAVGKWLFLVTDTGTYSCVEPARGKIVWQRRVAARFYGSPVSVGGRLYCISRSGEVFVHAASDKYKLLATNKLGEPSQATPAVAGGRMYLRTWSNLICVGGKP